MYRMGTVAQHGFVCDGGRWVIKTEKSEDKDLEHVKFDATSNNKQKPHRLF